MTYSSLEKCHFQARDHLVYLSSYVLDLIVLCIIRQAHNLHKLEEMLISGKGSGISGSVCSGSDCAIHKGEVYRYNINKDYETHKCSLY